MGRTCGAVLLVLASSVLACRTEPEADDEAGTTTSPSTTDADADVTTSDDESSTTSDDESSSTSDSEDSSTSDSEDELGFIVRPDHEGDPVDCNIILQDCPDGEKCIPYASSGGSWDANKCVPVMGDQQAGEICHWSGIFEGTDDCDANSMCWDVMDVEGELLGTCVLFCTGTPDNPECPPTYSCVITSRGSLSFCISDCDPLLQDCGEGLACFWSVSNFSCIFTNDELPIGEPCGYINDCAAGNYCADAMALPDCAEPACCTNFCDLELGDSQCAALPGTACVPFFEENQAPPGYEHIGLCILPA